MPTHGAFGPQRAKDAQKQRELEAALTPSWRDPFWEFNNGSERAFMKAIVEKNDNQIRQGKKCFLAKGTGCVLFAYNESDSQTTESSYILGTAYGFMYLRPSLLEDEYVKKALAHDLNSVFTSDGAVKKEIGLFFNVMDNDAALEMQTLAFYVQPQASENTPHLFTLEMKTYGADEKVDPERSYMIYDSATYKPSNGEFALSFIPNQVAEPLLDQAIKRLS